MRIAAPAATVMMLGLATPALAAQPYDFDSSGRQQAVLGVPGWSAGGAPNAGAAIVLRGSRGSVSRSPGFLMQGAAGLPGIPQGDDAFGAWTASADFNGDGFADLAVAVPGDGVTMVLSGSSSGLRRTNSRVVPAVGPLVAGDLDRDGHADLAVGEPFAIEHRNSDFSEGRIRLFKGGRHGVRTTAWRTLRSSRRHDYGFGAALALGDINRDGWPDLVEGAVGATENSDGEGVPGQVAFCAGRRTGPDACHAIGRALAGGPATLAVADMDGDGYGDVIAGRPVDDFVSEGEDPPGAVSVWRGARNRPASRPLEITQDSPGIPGHGEVGDAFGASIAAWDIDRDGAADLIIGAPGEDKGRGRVTVIRGGPRGYRTTGSRTLQEGAGRIRGPRRADDHFGAAVALLRLRARGDVDIVIGAPGHRSVTVIRVPGPGRAAPIQVVTPSYLGLRVPAEPPDALPGFGALIARPAGSL